MVVRMARRIAARPGLHPNEPEPVILHSVTTSFDVSIATPDGPCTAAMSVPDSGGPAPAVIMYPDAGGLRESFRGMGERLASMGYVSLVPDVYHRTPTSRSRWPLRSPTRVSGPGCSR